MPEPIVQVIELSKTYRNGDIEVKALQKVTLTVEAGEFIAVMGPSGSGKSTFLNLIGCLDRPSSGSYRLNGEEVSQLNDNQLAEIRSRQIGFVFQTFNLLPRATALQNVALPLIYRRDGRQLDRALEILTMVGLSDKANFKPNQLSGGQQQRTAIARALVNEPSLILADEPTGNLDTKAGEEVMVILQDLHRRGKTIILVTHEETIAEHASRMVRFRDGRIVSDQPIISPLSAIEILVKLPVEADPAG